MMQNYSVANKAFVLSLLATLSPIAGFAMEIALAWRFGASGTVDSFRIASLVLVFGNQVFLGQLLPHVVVPLFSEYRARKLEQDAWRLMVSLLGMLGLISLVFAIWVWFYPATLIELLAPGLSGVGRADAFLLIRYFSWAFVLMALSGVMTGVLYCHQVFWPPLAAQVLTNLLVIAAIFAVGREWGGGALALGILLGSVAMFCLHLYYLVRIARISTIHFPALVRLGPWDGVANALRLSAPLFGMILLGQWSIIVINRVLSEMPPGTLANFGYAWKLLALAGILPASLATVLFPLFADAHAYKNPSEFSRLVTRAIRMTFLLTIPVAAFLFVMRTPLISLLLERGAMSRSAVMDTTQIFGVLLIGTPAGALMVVLHKVFFSVQDSRSPAIVAFISALVITWLVPYAAGAGRANGVAWAINAIAWASTFGLLAYYFGRYRFLRLSNFAPYCFSLAALGTGVALSSMAIRTVFELNVQMTPSTALLEIVLASLTSTLVGYHLSRLLRVHESSEIWRYIKWQLRRSALNILVVK